jgi:homoserine kinase
LAEQPLPAEDIIHLGTELEHHPDNVSPCVLGGFTVSSIVGAKVTCIQQEVDPSLTFVTAIPEFEMDTHEARKLLPEFYSRRETIHALNRASAISAAFIARDYQKLRGLFDDQFHQPHRQKLLPQLGRVIQAATEAGAIGGWLSGAGSGIMCLAAEQVEAVAEAMRKNLGSGEVLLLRAENSGLTILEL